MSRTDAVIPERKQLLREAAQWLTRLDKGELSESERNSLIEWSQSSPEHQRVWRAACQLNEQFMQVPSELAKPVLGRARTDRRTVLKSILGFGLVIPFGWLLNSNKPWQPVLADFKTDIGEVKHFVLSDGSQLILNTDSAVDVTFDGQRRLIKLIQGEIFIRTAKDARPLLVNTSQGGVRALGTAFSVRDLATNIRVVVTEDAVEISPAVGLEKKIIYSGQQCEFNQNHISDLSAAPAKSQAWQGEEIIVDNWRLQDFMRELSRYRIGTIRCSDEVADLRISGVFQTSDTDQTLAVLEQAFNLKVTRFTDYWLEIGIAEK